MNDPEVARLRRLRSSALLVRTIARELADTSAAANEVLLLNAACASWRIARTVSGRLKAHPYARYQKDASIACLVSNTVTAKLLALTTRRRMKALVAMERHLRLLLRQLGDARVLTWTPDLSDAFGRSQAELEGLLGAFERETNGALVPARPTSSEQRATPLASRITDDWPYLAF